MTVLKLRREISPDGKRLSKVPPDDWTLRAFADELSEELGENSPLSHVHLMKLRKALREQPERILCAIGESVLPFIQGLPDVDWSIVGAELADQGLEAVCNRCLTPREKARIPKGDRYTRQEADEYELTCDRCGKRL
jgi:hypothetical protein